MNLKRPTLLALMILLFIYCGPKQHKVERIVENGVEVVLNHLEPYSVQGQSSRLSLEQEFTIDTERADVAKTGLADITGFDLDSEGDIYFNYFKTKGYYFFKFDKTGKFVSSFARKGQGPGEIQQPKFHPSKFLYQNEILIVDQGRNKLLIFSEDGNLKREIALDPATEELSPLENGKYLALKRRVVGSNEVQFEFALTLCASDLTGLKELDRVTIPNVQASGRLDATRIFALFWCVSLRTIYVANDDRGYEIWAYDLDGNLVRKIRKVYQPIKVPPGFGKRLLKLLETSGDESARKNIYFSEYMPPLRYIFADDEGRLFVMTSERGTNPKEFVYDIFGPGGIFIGRTDLGNVGDIGDFIEEQPLDVRVQKNRLHCLRDKDNGYKELVVYKMRWAQ